MGAPYTIVFGAYTFPNTTFEVEGLPLENILDEAQIPRRDGSRILSQKLTSRKVRIKGIIHGETAETVHSNLNEFMQKLATLGKQNLYYRSDRYLKAWLRDFAHAYPKGAFYHAANVDLRFVADDPYLYSTTLTTHTEALNTLVGGSKLFDIVNLGIVTAVPVIRMVAGVTITDDIFFHDTTNGDRFRWRGTLVPGMTLILDSEEMTVELGNGVDGLTQFDGDFMVLAGLTNNMRYAGATLTLFEVGYRQRYLA